MWRRTKNTFDKNSINRQTFITSLQILPKIKSGIQWMLEGCARIYEWVHRETEIHPWRLITIGTGLLFLAVCIIFALPLRTVSKQATVTYFETVIEQEPYVINEAYTVSEVHDKSKILYDDVRLSVPGGINIPFIIDKPNSRLTISFESPAPGGFYIFSSASHILYEQFGNEGTFDIHLPEGEYTGRFSENAMWSEKVHISILMKWTEQVEVTKYKEVTKHRDVPVKVERQRTTTVYEKASIWQLLFGDSSNSSDSQ